MSNKIESKLELLNRLYKEQDEMYRAYAVKKGISVTELWILYILYSSKEELSQQDLCQIWFYPKQTVNSAINKLVRDGYVILIPALGSRNKKNVFLTKEGKQFCLKTIKPLIEAEKASLLQLSEEELNSYFNLFAKQVKSLKLELESEENN